MTETETLQQVLVKLIVLLQGKQAQWTAVGPGSLGLHRQLDETLERHAWLLGAEARS